MIKNRKGGLKTKKDQSDPYPLKRINKKLNSTRNSLRGGSSERSDGEGGMVVSRREGRLK